LLILDFGMEEEEMPAGQIKNQQSELINRQLNSWA
jgi:hypothetical protein